MKLNLGSHDRIIPGYDNVDWGDYPGVKYKADVSDLSQFADNSVDIVRASHILEHFEHHRAIAILKEWRRVLKPNGMLYLSVPDWDRILVGYQTFGLCQWVIESLYCDQKYKGAYHNNVFDEKRIKDHLREAGFSDVSRVELLPDSDKKECSQNTLNLDGKSVSINIIAIK